MKQAVIENPVLNSTFEEPRKHFQFSDEGITNEEVESRRVSSYFVPIAKPKKRGKQLALIYPNRLIQKLAFRLFPNNAASSPAWAASRQKWISLNIFRPKPRQSLLPCCPRFYKRQEIL
ncbi:MAG: hypothetical protein Q8P12_06200 [bacterium]|nr:hypothetical protein [bacterium]